MTNEEDERTGDVLVAAGVNYHAHLACKTWAAFVRDPERLAEHAEQMAKLAQCLLLWSTRRPSQAADGGT